MSKSCRGLISLLKYIRLVLSLNMTLPFSVGLAVFWQLGANLSLNYLPPAALGWRAGPANDRYIMFAGWGLPEYTSDGSRQASATHRQPGGAQLQLYPDVRGMSLSYTRTSSET